EPSAVMQNMFAAGVRFENEVIDDLKALHRDDPGVVFLESAADRGDYKEMKRWQDESMAAFNNPDVWFIVNPRLQPVPALNLTGEPDFAVRGPDGWYPVDGKDHKELVGSSKP